MDHWRGMTESFDQMVTTTPYNEFQWAHSGAANARSGERLVQRFIALVQGVSGVKSICDLGCGNGYMAGRLAGLGYEVTGVDASESGILLAREAYPNVTFLHSKIDGNLCELTKGAEFDLVLSSDVIEHLYCPSDLIEASSSILKDNGQLLIGAPYHGYLKNLVLAATGKMDSHFCVLDDGGHIKFFSVATLSQLLRTHSFTDLKFSFYGRAPFLWMNMICLARKGG